MKGAPCSLVVTARSTVLPNLGSGGREVMPLRGRAMRASWLACSRHEGSIVPPTIVASAMPDCNAAHAEWGGLSLPGRWGNTGERHRAGDMGEADSAVQRKQLLGARRDWAGRADPVWPYAKHVPCPFWREKRCDTMGRTAEAKRSELVAFSLKTPSNLCRGGGIKP
jgi:hypothetical protein